LRNEGFQVADLGAHVPVITGSAGGRNPLSRKPLTTRS
jgi:hypothetical protein